MRCQNCKIEPHPSQFLKFTVIMYAGWSNLSGLSERQNETVAGAPAPREPQILLHCFKPIIRESNKRQAAPQDALLRKPL